MNCFNSYSLLFLLSKLFPCFVFEWFLTINSIGRYYYDAFANVLESTFVSNKVLLLGSCSRILLENVSADLEVNLFKGNSLSLIKCLGCFSLALWLLNACLPTFDSLKFCWVFQQVFTKLSSTFHCFLHYLMLFVIYA